MITFSQIELATYYEKMGLPPEQIEMIRQTGMLDGNYIVVAMIVGCAAAFGFMLWVRRYFVAEANRT